MLHSTYVLEYELNSKLKYIKLYFDTPVYDEVTRDQAAKFVDVLSAIGGTMGLLTGFSIISGVEILYFVTKICIKLIIKFDIWKIISLQ